jgi:hypothetical protein
MAKRPAGELKHTHSRTDTTDTTDTISPLYADFTDTYKEHTISRDYMGGTIVQNIQFYAGVS